jgi:hypothetical protein
MASYEQLPGTLNLSLRRGDDFSVDADFSIALTGSFLTASAHSVVNDTQVITFTTTLTDAEQGLVNMTLTSAQTQVLAVGTYSWRLVATSGGITRTYLAGYLEVTA